jgi:hypothetical protein
MTGPTGPPRGTGRALWGGGEVRSTAEPGNSSGGKGPQFKTDARRIAGHGDWPTYQLQIMFRKLPMASHAKDGVKSCPRAGSAKSACPVRGAGCGNGATAEPLRHRQTKGAETDMRSLTSPRHISTLPSRDVAQNVSNAQISLKKPSSIPLMGIARRVSETGWKGYLGGAWAAILGAMRPALPEAYSSALVGRVVSGFGR